MSGLEFLQDWGFWVVVAALGFLGVVIAIRYAARNVDCFGLGPGQF